MLNRIIYAVAVAAVVFSSAASAVNRPDPAQITVKSAPMVDKNTHRSAGPTRKIFVDQAQLESVAALNPARRLDYGAFSVLEVDQAVAARLIADGTARNADGENLLMLNTGPIDTLSAQGKAIGAAPAPKSAGKRLRLVQFPGPIQDRWVAALNATGAQIVSYMPSNAYLVYGDSPALEAVSRLSANGTAQWSGPYLDAFKLQPGAIEHAKVALLRDSKPPLRTANSRFQVQLVRDPQANAATEALLSAGQRIPDWRYEILSYVNIVAEIAADQLDAVAARPDVVSIAPFIEPVKHDERQNMILAGNLTGNVPNAGNYLSTLSGWGFTQAQFNASGFIVDVTDDGADRNPTGADPGTIATNANAGPVASRHFVLREGGLMANASRFIYKGRWGSASTTDGGLGLAGHGQINMSIVGGFVPDALDPTGTRVHRDPQGFRYGLGVAPFVRMANSVIFDPGFTNPNYPNMLSAGYGAGTRVSSCPCWWRLQY